MSDNDVSIPPLRTGVVFAEWTPEVRDKLKAAKHGLKLWKRGVGCVASRSATHPRDLDAHPRDFRNKDPFIQGAPDNGQCPLERRRPRRAVDLLGP